MSEKRKADAVITFQVRDGAFQKFELFNSEQFVSEHFASAAFVDQPKVDEEGNQTVRVRHNGVWLPRDQRVLLPVKEVMGLVERTARRQLKSEN